VSWCELETKNEARGRKFGLGSGRHFLKGVAAWSGGVVRYGGHATQQMLGRGPAQLGAMVASQ
jgi:hypothetical protein